MNKIIIMALTLLLASCAGSALKKEWQQRGYSKDDMDLIETYQKDYSHTMAQAMVGSSRFNTGPHQDAERRMRSIFCTCIKKMGDKCRQKPDGLTGPEKTLWAKSNAAEMAIRSVGTDANLLNSDAGKVDDAECGSFQ